MKIRLIYILIFALMGISAYSQDEKKYEKLIRRYDVRLKLKGMNKSSVSNFWNRIAITNQDKNNFEQKIDSRLAKSSIGEICEAISLNKMYLKTCDKYTLNKEAVMFVQDSLCGTKLDENVKDVMLLIDDELNAFCTPDGYIGINEGLVNLTDNKIQLLGVMAHEMAHFQLWHSLIGIYGTKKREQRNEIIAGVMSGATAVAEMYNQVNSPISEKEREYRWEQVDVGITNLYRSAKRNAYLYNFKYSREQEVEADIIAYRFLEWAYGSGGEYIKIMEKMRDENPPYIRSFEDKESGHPSFDFRIGLLKHLMLMDKQRTSLMSNN